MEFAVVAAANMVEVAALVGDTARATMLSALMGGRALTATELAFLAHVSRSTASEHLAKLVGARLISVTKKRRFSYYRITSPLVARMLESIKVVAAIEAPPRYQPRSPQDAALRLARTCYDHLAGHLGVGIADTLSARGLIVLTDDGGVVTPKGQDFFRRFGVALNQPKNRRTFCRPCLDWSERRFHVAGLVGAHLLRTFIDRSWLEPQQDTRAMLITPAGQKGFAATFGVVGLCGRPLLQDTLRARPGDHSQLEPSG
jgi:DNA-binding transcriptional ArsR family regulator